MSESNEQRFNTDSGGLSLSPKKNSFKSGFWSAAKEVVGEQKYVYHLSILRFVLINHNTKDDDYFITKIYIWVLILIFLFIHNIGHG